MRIHNLEHTLEITELNQAVNINLYNFFNRPRKLGLCLTELISAQCSERD